MKLGAITLNNDLSLFFIFFFIVLENQNVALTSSQKLEKDKGEVLQKAGETKTKIYVLLSPQMRVKQSILYKVVFTHSIISILK